MLSVLTNAIQIELVLRDVTFDTFLGLWSFPKTRWLQKGKKVI